MKLLITTAFVIGLLTPAVFGQGAQADQIKRRAKELNNQNNVRQGVTPPSQAPAKPAAPGTPAVAKPATPTVTTPEQNTAKIQASIAAIKAGSPVTPDQKTQLTKDIATAVRGTVKPSLPTVSKFVNELTAALAEKALGSAEQTRLAQNIEAVLNSATMPPLQFDAIIADVQAILQVGGAKRAAALAIAADLKAVGQEVRRRLIDGFSMSQGVQVKCPTCKKKGDWFAGSYGPFCSHRCKLIDLGKWLGEENAISEPLRPEHLDKYAELPPGEYLDRPETD